MRLPLSRLLAVLIALLLLVGWLQFRWIGELTRADRARLERARTEESAAFAEAVDREVFRLLSHFARAGRPNNFRRGSPDSSGPISGNTDLNNTDPENPDPGNSDPGNAEARDLAGDGERALAIRLEQLLASWSDGNSEPDLLAELFVVERPFTPRARLLELQSSNLISKPWTESLAPLHRAPRRRSPNFGPRGGLIESLPAVLVPLNLLQRPRGGPRRGQPSREPGNDSSQLLLILSRTYLEESLVPKAAQRFESTSFEIEVRNHQRETIYSTAGEDSEAFSTSDLATTFLSVRPFPGLLNSRWFSANRRRGSELAERPLDPQAGAWQLLVRHRDGSIEAAVRGARTRNLFLSLGILGILGASAALVAAAARRAQATAQLQVEFVAGLTHELHTPLAAISAAASNLADGVVEDRERVQQYGTLIRREGLRLESLVAQALTLAGIRSGQPQASEQIAVGEWLKESLDGCDWLVQEREATLVSSGEAEAVMIQGDRMALVRALRNLVTNALKFGPAGGTVEVITRCVPDQQLLTVTVSDHGPGFPASDREALLGAFVRGEGTSAGGSGLGLHVAQQIAEAHGGSIRLENRADGKPGASATIELPLRGLRA